MNWVDILLMLVVAASIISGFRVGMARVGVGFAATIIAIFCGFWFYGVVGAHLYDYVNSRPVANLVGFTLIFLGVMMLGAIVGNLLSTIFKWIGLSWLDRFLGGAFGFVRGVVIAVALVTVLLAFAPTPPPASITSSRLMPYVMGASSVMAALTPHEIKDAFQEAKKNVKRVWDQNKDKVLPLRKENS